MEPNILVAREGSVAVVKMNRPQVLNALNSATLAELSTIFSSLERDESVSVIVLTGEGKAFVAGADISEMAELTAEGGRAFARLGQSVFSQIEACIKPVIAAVNGFALGGGCELSLACDIRLASTKAKFGQPETGLGITPGFAGTQRLPKVVGVSKAKELIYTSAVIDAQEALRIGLVNHVYDEGELMEEAMKMAHKIAGNGQLAVRYAKAAIDAGLNMNAAAGSAIEESYFGLCFATEDQKGAMTAFLNKEKYTFKNR